MVLKLWSAEGHFATPIHSKGLTEPIQISRYRKANGPYRQDPPHPSRILFTPHSRDQLDALESIWPSREHFSLMPLHVQNGQLPGTEVVVEVYSGKQHRLHASIFFSFLIFFSTVLLCHVQKIMDRLYERPYVRF